MLAKYKKIIITFYLILLLVSYISYCVYIYKSPYTIIAYFPTGSSINQISGYLANNKIIANRYVFSLIMKILNKYQLPIISGEYRFTQNNSTFTIINHLIKGKRVVRKFTIPEGITINSVIKIINTTEGLLGLIEENLTECNILPNTYYYYYGDQKDTLIKKMKNAQKEFLQKSLKYYDYQILKNEQDVLNLASIVEKETALDSERAIIAGVYLNRLRLNMRLQADPTLIYSLSNGDGVIDHALTRAELKIDSPYNTYLKAGLPLTAIACPGKKSILAVISPIEHNYLYFVANDIDKSHLFATNLLQHNINNKIRKSLKNKL